MLKFNCDGVRVRAQRNGQEAERPNERVAENFKEMMWLGQGQCNKGREQSQT